MCVGVGGRGSELGYSSPFAPALLLKITHPVFKIHPRPAPTQQEGYTVHMLVRYGHHQRCAAFLDFKKGERRENNKVRLMLVVVVVASAAFLFNTNPPPTPGAGQHEARMLITHAADDVGVRPSLQQEGCTEHATVRHGAHQRCISILHSMQGCADGKGRKRC